MAKIYTRTGDDGETSLLGGERVRKDDLRIETIGSVDEINAALGVVRVELTRSGVAPEGVDAILAKAQHTLFNLGAELAARAATQSRAGHVERRRRGRVGDRDRSLRSRPRTAAGIHSAGRCGRGRPAARGALHLSAQRTATWSNWRPRSRSAANCCGTSIG